MNGRYRPNKTDVSIIDDDDVAPHDVLFDDVTFNVTAETVTDEDLVQNFTTGSNNTFRKALDFSCLALPLF